MPLLLGLSAGELIAKGIAPIKKEHLLHFISKPSEATSEATRADQLEAAGAEAAADGDRAHTHSAGSAAAGISNDGTLDVGDKVVAKKSKRQIRKDLKSEKSRTAGLCNNFLHGRCQYGDQCKYRHDATDYLANKEPDLPGRCPFSSLDACPYGVTCRWAGSHNQQQQQLLANATAHSAAAGTTAAHIPAAAAAAPVGTAEVPDGAALSAAISGSSSVIAATSAELQPVADLPLIRSIEPPLNGLPKHLQQQLWKGTFDFSKSDEVLQSLGLFTAAARKASWQQQQQRGRGGQGGRGQQRQQQQQRHEQHRGVATAEDQQAAKKQKLDDGAAAVAPAAAVAAAAGAADMLLDELYSAKEAGGDGSVAPAVAAAPHDTALAAAAAAAIVAPAAVAGPRNGADEVERSNESNSAAVTAEESSTVTVAASATTTEALDLLYDLVEHAPAAAAGVTAAPAPATVMAVAAPTTGTQALDHLYDLVQHAPAPAAAAQQPAIAAAREAPPEVAMPKSDGALIDSIQQQQQQQQRVGSSLDASREARSTRKLDITGKTYLAPLTTVGSLPFRRLCVGLGCDVTCGEMAVATNLLQGQNSEWALLKRHPCEKMFGIQVCGGYPDTMAQLAQVVNENVNCDFVDINCGCPIDVICNRGAGSALLTRPKQLERVVRATTGCLDKPVIVKIRKGYYDDNDIAHTLIPQLRSWGAAACTLHGRSRQQRYSRAADWGYIKMCAGIAHKSGLPLVGNGDVFSPTEWNSRLEAGVTTAMIGRAALIKPWIFTEIKEQRLWDISASERLDVLKTYTSHGLEHWGSDSRGVENTRRFLLEWLSFTHRYIPVGLLEVVPQKMSWRPPAYVARNDLEALMASEAARDWVKISEMLLGPAPAGFSFAPKHKSNAYTAAADLMQQMAAATTGGQHVQDVGGDEQENG